MLCILCVFLQIVEAEPEGGTTHYLVHYAGWNNRYDEWILKDRIMDVVECPEKPVKPLSQVMASKANKVGALVTAVQSH